MNNDGLRLNENERTMVRQMIRENLLAVDILKSMEPNVENKRRLCEVYRDCFELAARYRVCAYVVCDCIEFFCRQDRYDLAIAMAEWLSQYCEEEEAFKEFQPDVKNLLSTLEKIIGERGGTGEWREEE